MTTFKLATVLMGLSALSGCGSLRVDYGAIPHDAYVAGKGCDRPGEDQAQLRADGLFLVTSRLPDCRGDAIRLLNHRSPQVRYGRFTVPGGWSGDEEKSPLPLAFQAQGEWWSDLAAAAKPKRGRVLLYVHGYRETAGSTARDAAQIARLTGFDGPLIAYSWPSQGAVLKYAADETNMYWDERNFRVFLTSLARQEWVSEIIVVAHSLGARLVIPSIAYVDSISKSADASNISNIILASPDVDREDFERDIAEEVLAARRVNMDRRITIYLSARDKALSASRTLHGYPRLGSPLCFNPFEAAALRAKGLPERCYAAKSRYDTAPSKSGLTIVDTTEVKTGATGHSDFLRAGAACTDFAAVANGDRNGRNRLPTHLDHVFRLAATPDVKPAANDLLCRLDRPAKSSQRKAG